MKMLWPHIAQLHCRQCGQPERKDSPQSIWNTLAAKRLSPEQSGGEKTEHLITFDLPLSEKLSIAESLALVAKQGYQRLLINGEIVRIEETVSRFTSHLSAPKCLTVIQDRLRPAPTNRARFIEACEQAYHFGKGKLAIRELPLTNEGTFGVHHFSDRLHCAQCDIEYRDPSPALFSFNNTVGACPACRGSDL